MRAAGAALFAVAAGVPLVPSASLWLLVMARGLLWR
jgi:hypothetical protein